MLPAMKMTPERATRRAPVGHHAAEIVAHRHAGEHDADDAGPRVEGHADVWSHDAAGDEFDDERAGTADEHERTGLPHEVAHEHRELATLPAGRRDGRQRSESHRPVRRCWPGRRWACPVKRPTPAVSMVGRRGRGREVLVPLARAVGPGHRRGRQLPRHLVATENVRWKKPSPAAATRRRSCGATASF